MLNIGIEIFLMYQRAKLGLVIKRATTYEELVAVDAFRQNQYKEYFGLDKIPQTTELVQPPGLVGFWYLQSKEGIVGCVCLFDPLIIEPYVQYCFSGAVLDYPRARTYELGRLIINRSFQRHDNLIFLNLIYECYKESRKHGRDRWLVGTHKRILKQAQYIGGKVDILSSKPKIEVSDTLQSRYWANCVGYQGIDENSAYLIHCGEADMRHIAYRFFSKKWKILKWKPRKS